jgi:hypothetical protein
MVTDIGNDSSVSQFNNPVTALGKARVMRDDQKSGLQTGVDRTQQFKNIIG